MTIDSIPKYMVSVVYFYKTGSNAKKKELIMSYVRTHQGLSVSVKGSVFNKQKDYKLHWIDWASLINNNQSTWLCKQKHFTNTKMVDLLSVKAFSKKAYKTKTV